MNEALILDTCAAIWIANDLKITSDARTAIREAENRTEVYVSPITAWELATLAAKGRLTLTMPVAKWFDHLLTRPGTVLADMPPKILIDSAFLPGKPPSDPADRIIVASAREFGLSVVTRDGDLLNYAAAGHVKALKC